MKANLLNSDHERTPICISVPLPDDSNTQVESQHLSSFCKEPDLTCISINVGNLLTTTKLSPQRKNEQESELWDLKKKLVYDVKIFDCKSNLLQSQSPPALD